LSIVHEYNNDEELTENFAVASFFNNVCVNANNGFLDSQYTRNFKNLISFLKTKSKDELLNLVKDASAKCTFAG
jgi:hypothetical protein